MNIALVGPSHPHRGGIAQYTALLHRELATAHAVTHVSYSRLYPGLLFPGTTQFDASASALAVPSCALIDSIGPLSWFRAARALAAARPELALVMWWHPFFAPALGTIARRLAAAGIRVVFTCHNVVPHESAGLLRHLSKWAFAPASAFVLHSAAERPSLQALVPGARTVVTPLPSFDHFVPAALPDAAAARRALSIARGRVLLFFGLIRAYKGVRTLIRAFSELASDPELELVIAGECYEPEAGYRALLSECGLTGRVRFENRFLSNEEVATYVRAADVVVLPYHTASQSGVIPVAYALERPVIATRVGGLPEVVREGETGLLVPPGDPAALAGAIREFFARGGRAAFAPGVARVRELFSWRRMREAIEELAGSL